MSLSEYGKTKFKVIAKDQFIEAVCREMCLIDKVNPDMIAVGIGFTMPAGEAYPLWKARIRYAEAIFNKFCTIEEE